MKNRLRGITRSFAHAMSNCHEGGIPPGIFRRLTGAIDAEADHFDEADLDRWYAYEDGMSEPYGCGCPTCLASGSTNVPPFRTDLIINT